MRVLRQGHPGDAEEKRKKKKKTGRGKCSPHTGRHATLCSALDNETPTVAATLVAISCVTSSHPTPSLFMRREWQATPPKG